VTQRRGGECSWGSRVLHPHCCWAHASHGPVVDLVTASRDVPSRTTPKLSSIAYSADPKSPLLGEPSPPTVMSQAVAPSAYVVVPSWCASHSTCRKHHSQHSQQTASRQPADSQRPAGLRVQPGRDTLASRRQPCAGHLVTGSTSTPGGLGAAISYIRWHVQSHVTMPEIPKSSAANTPPHKPAASNQQAGSQQEAALSPHLQMSQNSEPALAAKVPGQARSAGRGAPVVAEGARRAEQAAGAEGRVRVLPRRAHLDTQPRHMQQPLHVVCASVPACTAPAGGE